MPISETSRRAMYDAFHPLLGDEATDDMLSCFPTSHDELPASREFVRAEIAELRVDLVGRIDAQGTELRGELATLGTELRAEMADVRVGIEGAMRQQTMWLTGVLVAVAGVVGAAGVLG